ncbi:rhodanese-like domain-containing protein [Flavobacterium sandaracinum]
MSFIFSVALSAQNSIPQVLKKLNKETIPYIKVGELKNKKSLVYLDAREPKEFNVSHIKNAIPVGFDHFDAKKVSATVKDKSATIVVYCSIGVRSEQIGEKLQKLGYKNVYNLYGGIFEYKNFGGKVVNNQNKVTDSIHTFNQTWSAYLTKGIKVYEN